MAEPNPKLWIGNLHHKVSKEDLNLQFCGYGTIQDIKVLDKGPHVYAFVEYSKTEEAEKAFKALQGTEIKGQAMKIEYAQGRKRYFEIISQKNNRQSRDRHSRKRDSYGRRRSRSRSHERHDRHDRHKKKSKSHRRRSSSSESSKHRHRQKPLKSPSGSEHLSNS